MATRRQRPLSISTSPPAKNDAVPTTAPSPQSVLTRALQSSANLANLLPTGTIFAFQILTPFVTNGGLCEFTTKPLALLFALALSCFLASFTDSVKCSDGDVHYGFVTAEGLWMFDVSAAGAAVLPDLSKYKLKAMDLVHASLSVVVFAAVAMRDKNVVGCLYPEPGNEVQKVLDVLPVVVGFGCSLLFVIFPTTRHGIGYPLTRDS